VELDIFRGFGGPVAKSLRLLAESVQPPFARTIAVELLGAGAGEPSKHVAVPPYPTMSTIFTPLGQAADKTAFAFSKATLPEPAARLIVPVASGVGSVTPLAAPDAS
jgi:hypothetical protein